MGYSESDTVDALDLGACAGRRKGDDHLRQLLQSAMQVTMLLNGQAADRFATRELAVRLEVDMVAPPVRDAGNFNRHTSVVGVFKVVQR